HALVRRPRPARGDPRWPAHERARRTNPLQQERLHPRRRPNGRGWPRPTSAPRERPPLDPRRPDRRGPHHDGASPPPPPARDRTALLQPPRRHRHQDAHPRPRETQHPRPPPPPRTHPQLASQELAIAAFVLAVSVGLSRTQM